MLVSVRGGGHHIAGNAVADGSLVIDQSGLRAVRVDPERRTARVAAGALLGDVDHETQAFGLATPLGINSTTGVAGLCLGGGFGWLTRKYGMTIDNLISADIVTADGRQRVVSASQEPDLFWAIRGGGGNFGVVTSFEFQLHPVGPEVYSGLVVYPFDAGAAGASGVARLHARRADRPQRMGRAAQGAAAAVPARIGPRPGRGRVRGRPRRRSRRRRTCRRAGAPSSAARSEAC